MRINSKSIITLLIAFLMIFGTAFYSFSAADSTPNTQIHLKIQDVSLPKDKTVLCYIVGTYAGLPSVKIDGIDASILTMNPNGGGNQYDALDMNLNIKPVVIYFTIDGIVYRIGQEVSFLGQEGNGTMNYEVVSLPKYNLTYNPNGATTGNTPNGLTQVVAGSNITVSGNIGNLEKVVETIDYKFEGWNTVAGGTGTTYLAGSTLVMPFADVILYAQWSMIPKHDVIYNPGEADPSTSEVPSTRQYSEGKIVTVEPQGPNLKRSGWNFIGWSYNGRTYNADETLIMGTSNIVFTAVWSKQQTYTVTYDGNGNTSGTVPKDNSVYFKDATVTIKDQATLEKLHYTFKGWSTTPDGLNKVGSTITMGTANITLYAVWENDPTYKVNYNGNGNTSGSAPVDTTAYYIGDKPTAKDELDLAKLNHTFSGWNTKQDGTGTTYLVDAEILIADHDVYLFAIWTPDPTYRVTYNANDGAGEVPVDEGVYYNNEKATVLDGSNLTKPNHKIIGWKIGNEEKVYKPGDELTITGNVMLTAVWEFVPPQESNPTSTNPPEETNPPSTNPPQETNPPTTEPTTVATTEATLVEIEIEEEVGAPAGAASSIVETIEELVELDEPVVPLGDALPQTGQLPVELFYGVGGLITAAGIYLKRKSS